MRRLLWMAVLAGCGGDYELRIEFESEELAADAQAVDVWIVAQCPDEADWTTPPLQALQSSASRRGEKGPELGDIGEGDYGIQAIARDRRCAVVAAACLDVSLRSGDEHTLVVTLGARASPTRCPDTQVCGVGLCLPEGTCAELGSPCSPELACCDGTCAPEVGACVEVQGGGG